MSDIGANTPFKIAPFGRSDAPQAARHLVQRYASLDP